MAKKNLSRRDFLRLGGLAAASTALAACGGAEAPEPQTIIETVIVEKEVAGETVKVVETVEVMKEV